MKGLFASLAMSFLLISTTVISIPFYEDVYSLPPETETFTIPIQKDSFLKQGSEKDNEGANPILDIKSSDKHRPVVAFDQNDILDTLDGRPLHSAILRLHVIENGNNWGPSGNTIGIHRLLSDWQEGNGWNLGNNLPGTGSGVT